MFTIFRINTINVYTFTDNVFANQMPLTNLTTRGNIILGERPDEVGHLTRYNYPSLSPASGARNGKMVVN